MSRTIRLPEGAWVLVADARKALLLVNRGDAEMPDLRVEQVIEAGDNPRTSGQGADRPGRTIYAGRHSAVEQTDWHRMAEVAFAATVMERLFAEATPPALVVAAPPGFLAELRKRMPKRVKANVLAECDKDLTHLPAYEIEQALVALPAQV
jgi:protein required for attachment to host cells